MIIHGIIHATIQFITLFNITQCHNMHLSPYLHAHLELTAAGVSGLTEATSCTVKLTVAGVSVVITFIVTISDYYYYHEFCCC